MFNIKNFQIEERSTTLDIEKQQNVFSLSMLEDNEFLSKEDCSNLIRFSEEIPLVKGLSRTNSRVDYRDSDVTFLSYGDNENLYRKIIDRANFVNDKFLKFDITHLGRLQYSKYSKDQFLNSHDDDYFKYYYKENTALLQRKLSISILLSAPDEYEGGEFEIEPNTIDKIYSTKPNIGTAVLFPSFMVHRVKKVTKGIRRSLVCWFYGKPWR